MERPLNSLFWSGLAAGLSLSFSLLTQAILHHHLPDAPWRPLVTDAGYTVGFLIVILGHQQLFTENTITVVLPLLAEFNRRNLFLTALGLSHDWWEMLFRGISAGFLIAALVFNGQWSLLHLATHFEVPVLIGNSIGGTALFAVLSYAQVMKEM